MARYEGGTPRNKYGAQPTSDYLEEAAGGYTSGVSGSVSVPSGHRLVALTCQAGTASPGSVVVDGGTAIPVPAGAAFDWAPRTLFVAPSIVFDATVTYVVEYAAL